MTSSQLEQVLISTGVKVAYSHFKKAQSPPYIVYYATGGEVRGSDNRSGCVKEQNYEIELYTSEKNTECENAIEAALISKNIEFSKDETYIDTEKVYMVSYSISFIDKI